MDTSTAWNGQEMNPPSTTQDAFQQFLDINMNFDFPDFGARGSGHIQPDSGEAMDTAMDGDVALLDNKNMLQGWIPPITTAPGLETVSGTTINPGSSSAESLVDLDAQIRYLQQQRQQQQDRLMQEQQNFYNQNHVVPPTPESVGMCNANGKQFYTESDSQRQAIYESIKLRLKEQEMTFTPLVSPAGTPLETHFNMPEYTVPGAYFSPLSSPALHAQSESEHRSIYGSQAGDGSATTSPVDMNMESNFALANNTNSIKKGTKRVEAKPRTPRLAGRSVRKSPIVKPHRRKHGGSTTISSQALADIAEPAASDRARNQGSSVSTSSEGSENESISPEPLSDMAPPPLPRSGSAGRSPFLKGQNDDMKSPTATNGSHISPATPASLMRLAKSNQTSPSLSKLQDADDQAMESFQLPEAVNPVRPQLSRIQTQSDGHSTPTLDTSTVSTPAFQSLPSPAFARPLAAAFQSSPRLASSNGSSSGRKKNQVAPQSSKKRSTVSSVQISPALRPKISPSIKPLIRSGSSVSEDTASLLLASKSNYQNILEGTHLPGVSYPTELSTNLTSKRTSHKIAEQGRRNRINSALQEIATLLPHSCGKESGNEAKSVSCETGEKDESSGTGTGVGTKGGGQCANSKASTVELAIEYIKQLRQEVAEANMRAEEAEKKLKMRSC